MRSTTGLTPTFAFSVFATVWATTAAAQTGAPIQDGDPNVPGLSPAFAAQTEAPAIDSGFELEQEVVASGLVHPWAVVPLPNAEGYLVTERPGRLRHVAPDGTLSDPIDGVPAVLSQNQGGLLDIALAPDFGDSRVLYMTYAKPVDGGSATAAARAVLSPDMTRLSEVEDIFVQSPPSSTPMHYGSRVVPTDDGHVYITTGEHFTMAERDLAQTLSASYGSVIRVTAEGDVPDDNPFLDTDAALPEIFSHGHRNPQGAAMHPDTGTLWIIEHGPAGGDELNQIEAGGNYGWPVVSYGERYNGTPVGAGTATHAPEFVEPRYYWDPVIAPGGMVFYDGEMFPEWQGDVLASGLVAAAVVRLDLEDDTVMGEERLAQGIGRVRDIDIDADGSILIVLDFEDGELIRLSRP